MYDEIAQTIAYLRYLAGLCASIEYFVIPICSTTRVVSGLSLTVWDTFLTLRQEIRFIWAGPHLLVRLAYSVNRYGTFVLIIIIITLLGTLNRSVVYKSRRSHYIIQAWHRMLLNLNGIA